MSKYKDPTADTPPSSSAESTAAKAPPSGPSASSDNMPSSTPTTKEPSPPISPTVESDSTTLTTLQITEKARQHAMLAKVALSQLEKAGLIKRFKVLSRDAETGLTTLKEIRIVFDNSIWTEELELR